MKYDDDVCKPMIVCEEYRKIFEGVYNKVVRLQQKRGLEMRLKSCHVPLQHYHKSVLTVALMLH